MNASFLKNCFRLFAMPFYISKKPLIATTNLTPEQLRNPEDVPHAFMAGCLKCVCLSALQAAISAK